MNRMTIRPLLVLLIVALGSSFLLADEAVDKALKDKGLELKGNNYQLDELEIIKGMVEVNKLKAAMTAAERKAKTFEKAIDRAKAFIANRQYELQKLKTKASTPQTKADYDKLVNEIATVTADISKITKQKAEKEKEMQGLVDKARADFSQYVVNLSKTADGLMEKYKAIAEDAAVKELVEKSAEEKKRKLTVGPTRPFEINHANLAKYRAGIESGEITLRKEGNIMMVDVMLNGKASRGMVLDTGASSIMLPADFAEEIGLVPTDAHETIQMQQADGTLVDAKRMMLDEVQVGQFRVASVECIVLDKKAIAASPLLGNTFLKNFHYRINPEEGKLYLTRLRGEEKPKDEKEKDKDKDKTAAADKK